MLKHEVHKCAVSILFWHQEASGKFSHTAGSQNIKSFGQRPPAWQMLAMNQERLLIFSVDAGSKTSDKGRAAAERLVNEMVQDLGLDKRPDGLTV